ncbi:MAG: DegT/DnrJ/EryC1/StrS family aminotransferase [Herpetosiphon sp.]
MHIPFVDLRAQHDEVQDDMTAAIRGVIDRSAFIGGPDVTAFEQHFATYCQTAHSVACATGIDALKLALMAAGVRRGDEVVTVPHTFIATVEAMTLVGAFPAFVDIDGPTYCMAPDSLLEFLESCHEGPEGRLINPRTGRPISAVVPVHLYGLPADMEALLDVAERFSLPVVEDACQAHGASCRVKGVDRRAGSLGVAASFSFYPGKNLGGIGEGGATTTNNTALDQQMRIWRDHGQQERYIHVSPDGWNGRLDTLQCAVLDIKLRKLDQWNANRRQAAAWYRERLQGDERIVLPVEPAGRHHVYHLFVVRLPDREQIRESLSAQGIGVGLHYPIPLHLQEAYRGWGWQQGDFPETEAAAQRILSLPMFPHITEEQVDHVCARLKATLG